MTGCNVGAHWSYSIYAERGLVSARKSVGFNDE